MKVTGVLERNRETDRLGPAPVASPREMSALEGDGANDWR